MATVNPRQQSRKNRDRQRLAAETPEEKRRRLDRQKEYRRQRRETERLEQTEARRSRARQRQRARREYEDEQVREARLERMREHERIQRGGETLEARTARLERTREHAQVVRSEETSETRAARLEGMREHAQTVRGEETSEARLEGMREYAQQTQNSGSRFNVTVEDEVYCPVFCKISIQKKMENFHSKLGKCSFFECATCSESFPILKLPGSNECTRCTRDKKKRFSRDNGMDPGPVPPQLQGLTQVEEMLISAVMPMMCLYRLPLGQYGYSGHVVNLPQDISTFVTSLPRLPSDIDVILVCKEGASDSHKDFRVRRSKVLGALQWLKQNNKYYSDISLDHSALAQLPEDGNITGLSTIVMPLDDDDHVNDSAPADDDTFMSGTFVPMVPRKETEQNVIRQSISSRQGRDNRDGLVQWPQVANTPINEFKTEGYMTCAFPTLFPTGEADFAAPRVYKVTIGDYMKHLMMYRDGRFARHPRFRYFALNTEMRWRALQAGNIYVRQHTRDAQLTVDELREMVGSEGEAFSNRVLRYAGSLRGTSSYWFKQRSRLIAMVDTLGLPTIFLTHSAADLQWPELARLICPDNPESRSRRSEAVVENPAIADWFFYQRIRLFLKEFYEDVLGVKDYWLRFEWQHRGSPHVHGLAWLSNAPSIEQGVVQGVSPQQQQEITQYIDKVVSTVNPAILEDGSNASDAPLPQVDPHVCNKPFDSVDDYEKDLKELIATCQRHTRCSPSYCLKNKNGEQQCRFGYPKPLKTETNLSRTDDGDIELVTKRNDPLINSFNPIQLSAWRANVDMQYCVSKNKVIAYCAKYATKCEPRSQPLKQVYKSVVGTLKDDDHALKAVHKLLTNSVGERDFSAQETCHLLLQLPLVMTSREFVYLNVDGTRLLDEKLTADEPATVLSCLDHYIARPTSSEFESATLLHFVQHYSMPRQGGDPKPRNKKVVVIVRPYLSSDRDSPNYEQYCRQRLMLHRPFRDEQQLLGSYETFTESYMSYLRTGNVPPCLQDDIHQLEQAERTRDDGSDDSEETEDDSLRDMESSGSRNVEEWMLICQHRAQLGGIQDSATQDVDWLEAGRRYPNLDEAPTFITRSKETHSHSRASQTSPNPQLLQGNQRQVYEAVQRQVTQQHLEPLRVIVSGTAGTGKSFLIGCLKRLLGGKVMVLAPTGVAAFNVNGCTLHSALRLPTKGEIKSLEGDALRHLQENLAEVEYIIIDEMSMVGRKMFGQVDQRLRQAFPQCADKVLGGRSCLLFGDFGQLPPVMDLPLYTSVSRSSLSDLGRSAYQAFDKAVVLTQVMRQQGQDPEQVRFREILLHLRDASVTREDWEHLMERRIGQVSSKDVFNQALHLLPTVNAVTEHNLDKLHKNSQPVAEIKAVHSGPRAHCATSEDAGGLEPVVHLAQDARVMLTSNLWVEAGLVNGAMGTVKAICYKAGGPPHLPTAVMVSFDSYSGPKMHDGTVPIIPIRRSWMTGGATCSRLQLPLKLAWAVTIHKAQGLTLSKAVIDVGSKEFCTGLTFVACSRVCSLTDLMFNQGFDFDRISNMANSVRFRERKTEDLRLQSLHENGLNH